MKLSFRIVPRQKKGKKLLKESAALYLRFSGSRTDPQFLIKTPIAFRPIDWNPEKQELKSSLANPNYKANNILLAKLKLYIDQKINELVSEGGTPTKEVATIWVDGYFKLKPKRKVEKGTSTQNRKIFVVDYLDYWIEYYMPKYRDPKTKKPFAKSSKLNYISQVNKFKKYEEEKGTRIKFSGFDEEVQDEITEWIRVEKGQGIGTQNNFTSKLKTIIHKYAIKKDNVIVHNQFPADSFAHQTEDTKMYVYLTLEEQESIAELDLVYNLELDAARDWLLLACRTGMAGVDLDRLNGEIRIDWEQQIISGERHKTTTKFAVPFSQDTHIQRIFAKYPNHIPPKPNYSNYGERRTVWNDLFKKVCELARIDEEVVVSYDNQKNPVMKKKWEKVGTHTGRRSFTTNWYQKVPIETIMLWCGWKNQSMPENYVKLTVEQKVIKSMDVYENATIKQLGKVS